MSVPTAYETHPFYPPAMFAVYMIINIYINTKIAVVSSIWYLYCVLGICRCLIYACAVFSFFRTRDRSIVIRHSTWEFFEFTTLKKQLKCSNVNGKIKILLFFLLVFWNPLWNATDLLIIILLENAEIYIRYLRKKVPPIWLQSHLFTKKVWFSTNKRNILLVWMTLIEQFPNDCRK